VVALLEARTPEPTATTTPRCAALTR